MSVSKTIKTSGGDYTTLSAWEAGMQADLTGTGYSEAVCFSLDDTSALGIVGWTTTADDYISIRVDSTARHAGKWDGDKYNLAVNNTDAITISEDYVRIDGLQVSVPAMNSNGDDPIAIINGGISASNDIRLSNLIVVGASDGTYYQFGIGVTDADTILKVWNCIVYGIGTVAASACFRNTGTVSIYSSTGIGGQYCLYVAGGVTTAKNVYAGGSSTEDYYRGAGTLNKTNCASEDQSADDTNTTVETATNCVAAAVLVDTDTFVNVTGGSEDFHLAADGNSPLQGAGVDTSGESAPLNFTTDIDGDTRSDWSIGADEGPTLITGAGGIASLASVGTPSIVGTILAAGAIAASLALGAPALRGNIQGTAGGIPSGAAIGSHTIQSPSPTAISSAGGIASVAAVGTPALRGTIQSTGAIPSAEAVGSPSLQGAVNLGGIQTGEVLGSPALCGTISGAGGIATGEALGSPKIRGFILSAGGIASGEAIGSHVLAGTDHVVGAGGIASGEAVGSPSLQGTISPSGVPSGEAVGSSIIAAVLPGVIQPSGIPSAAAVGSHRLTGSVLGAGGIASSTALGTPALVGIIRPSGIVTGEALGSAQVNGQIVASGIPTAEVVGPPRVVAVIREAGGIPSGSAVGEPRLNGTIHAPGIPTGEAVGDLRVVEPGAIYPGGIPSGGVIGNHTLSGTIHEGEPCGTWESRARCGDPKGAKCRVVGEKRRVVGEKPKRCPD